MSHDFDPQAVLRIADAQADAFKRWRAYKRATRNLKYRQRMEQVKALDNVMSFPAWLAAVERDEDPVERKHQVEEQAA